MNASHTRDNHWLKVEYRMDISAVADPPVAMRMRLDAMIRFRSYIVHRSWLRKLLLCILQYGQGVDQIVSMLGAEVADLISKGFRRSPWCR